MPDFKIAGLLASLILLGAGCALPKPPPLNSASTGQRQVSLNLDRQKQPDLPCISFRHRQGFEQWLNAYEKGGDDTALNLAINAKLPKRPNDKLVGDLRASLKDNAFPRFLCALDDKGEKIAWTLDAPSASLTECRALFYVSIKGRGTISEITAKDRTQDCKELCKPKIQSPQTFKWQCDVRETDKKTTWTEALMDRATGQVLINQCWKDDLGVLLGCTAP